MRAGVIALAAAFAFVGADTAAAAVKCTFAPGNGLLKVEPTQRNSAVIGRESTAPDSEITVETLRGNPVSCAGGTPTLTTTDRIELTARDSSNELVIDLHNGPLVPGATPEGDGFPEIEIGIRTIEEFSVFGTPGPDRFVVRGREFETVEMLLNAREDADIDLIAEGLSPGDLHPLAFVQPRAGDDFVRSKNLFLSFTVGGPGRDLLVGGRSFLEAFLGGPGRDRISGRGGIDLMRGGRGRDRLAGDRGTDALLARGGGKDRLRCGRGSDVFTADRSDGVRGCEDRAGRPSSAAASVAGARGTLRSRVLELFRRR